MGRCKDVIGTRKAVTGLKVVYILGITAELHDKSNSKMFFFLPEFVYNFFNFFQMMIYKNYGGMCYMY